LGLGTVLSFNDWAEFKLAGMTFFDAADFLTSRIMLPLTGLFIAIFVGWVLTPAISRQALNGEGSRIWSLWFGVLRYVCPPAIAVVLLMGLYDSFV
ncbi:MAG TPA: sodium-dependent transporter, partial [Porticoccaceae bacterium]|nr:sodium-dependent transporter [Porticoccaceae bacterium]